MQAPARPALPRGAGVSLKALHYREVLAGHARPAFFEVHAENYLHAGGPAHRHLEVIRTDHRLSVHGVGLSLGGAAAPDPYALRARAALLHRYQPDMFSEHLAWCGADGEYFNDLLPIAYTSAALARVSAHVDAVQEALGRQILIENPATYLRFDTSTLAETQFLDALVRATGCGLLLDVNNIIVSAINHGFDARDYLLRLPLHAVAEVHLAAHTLRADADGNPVCIDSHDGPVQPATWSLYGELLSHTGPLPTLIEWDGCLPAYDILLDQARQAEACMLRTPAVLRAAG